MRHLVFSPLMPPSRYGGIEIIASKLAAALAVRDEVRVVSLNPRGSAVRERRAGPVRITELPGHFYSDLSTDRANGVALDVLARLTAAEADVVHCHDWFFAAAGVVAARRLSAPLLGYFHTVKRTEAAVLGRPVTPFRRFVDARQERLAAAADRVVVYSDYMRGEVARSLGVADRKIVQFRCGPSLDAEPAPPAAPRPPGQGPALLYVGRLAPEKGVGTLLEAFAMLRARGRPATLRVIGSGPMITRLRSQAAAAGVAPWVTFEPFTESAAFLARAMADADVLVAPSRFEPYGLVAAEALCLGVPVVVSSGTGLAEVAGHGAYGETFAAESAGDLLRALAAVADDPGTARAKAARGRRFHRDQRAWPAAAPVVRGASAARPRAAS
jgi:1,4-alpha-glucan branching enzyme